MEVKTSRPPSGLMAGLNSQMPVFTSVTVVGAPKPSPSGSAL
jgi:hypothetical protein